MPAPQQSTAIFRFYAYAGTIDRVRPEDMGIGDFYFCLRYKCPQDNLWYYKTSSYVLSHNQNESNSQAILIDVSFVSGSHTQFVDAPFGIGTVYYELCVCNTLCSTWTTTKPSIVYKLPDFTINGVHYVNSGSFVIANYLQPSITEMNFAYSGYTYQESTINTSASEWALTIVPSWITAEVYRNSIKVTSGAYQDGDVLRVVPNSSPTAYRSGNIYVTVTDVGRNIYVTQAGPPPTFNHNADGFTWSAGPTASANTADTQIYITGTPSGFYSGSGTIPMYVWVKKDGVLQGSSMSFGAKDGMAYTQWITGLPALQSGATYNIYYSATDRSLE